MKAEAGSYVNGVYTSKNGFTGSGLNCPKGTRLYDTNVTTPFFFMPEDRGETEDFEILTDDVCPGIMPYYAISNYGRLMNVMSGKIMKPNYRPNGYEYYCLAAEGTKTGQKKYSTSRMVMKTFDPRENADELEVNHINGNKAENYINKTMPDGTVQSNIEWNTHSENASHRNETGLTVPLNLPAYKVSGIRNLRDKGYSYSSIHDEYPEVSVASIQLICKNALYTDPNYVPSNPNPYADNTYNKLKLTDKDAEMIRKLYSEGYTQKQISEKFFPNVSASSISDITRGKTHNTVR